MFGLLVRGLVPWLPAPHGVVLWIGQEEEKQEENKEEKEEKKATLYGWKGDVINVVK